MMEGTGRNISDESALDERAHCTVAEATRYANCCDTTIREWIRKKLIRASRPIKRGSSRVRVNVESLKAFVEGRS